MQGSTPRTRNTFPLSAARNFDGTVSRFFASSVCSKVPWKAKAHVLAARESVDPRWRSGRSPATPDRLRNVKVPHFPPLCNTEPVQHDTRPVRLPLHAPKTAVKSVVPGALAERGSSRRGMHGRVHGTDLHGDLRLRSAVWRPNPPWENPTRARGGGGLAWGRAGRGPVGGRAVGRVPGATGAAPSRRPAHRLQRRRLSLR